MTALEGLRKERLGKYVNFGQGFCRFSIQRVVCVISKISIL